ncbi:MAG: AAA family ATPase [Sedimentisphaerales bacterium]|nr:AAA family ATPase [Sedimentisphaerales bacterium]
MRLKHIRIENFRSFKDEPIEFDDYTCLVGPNGAGKSVVLMALNVFFQENASAPTDVRVLSEEDFHHKNKTSPIRITVTFEDLSEAAQKEFQLYYRQHKLVIIAEAKWDDSSGGAPVKHYGLRDVMQELSPYFEAEKEGTLVPELRDIYNSLRSQFDELPAETTKAAMTQALRDYEEKHPEKCTLTPESNQFFGFTRGAYHLANYIQWVYVPAVKDASTEQEEGTKTALGQLLARTVRTKLDFTDAIQMLKQDVEERYATLLEEKEEALKGLELSMLKRLQDYVNQRARLQLKWHFDAKTSITIRDPLARADIGDADFIGEVARSGHGLQRGFLLAILHEMAGNETQNGPRLLLGFEEPELYQHPPQAQHLSDVLQKLACTEGNAQIIVTTHSPYFVTAREFEGIRLFHKCPKGHCSKVAATTYKEVEKRLSDAMEEAPISPTSLMACVNQIMHPSQRELFFSPVPILVEGPEDVAYISAHLRLSEKWDAFRAFGCHFVVSGGKDNMGRFAAMAADLGIPAFVIFDSDNVGLRAKVESTVDDPGKHREAKANFDRNSKTNLCLLRLSAVAEPEPTSEETLWGQRAVMWGENIRSAVVADFGEQIWNEADSVVRNEHQLMDRVRQKNAMLIAATLEKLWSASKQSASLLKLCALMLQYAETVNK